MEVWQNGSRSLYITVQNTCKPISRLKMNGNRLTCYIKEEVIICIWRKRIPFPQTLSRNTLFSTADHMSDITFMILWSLTELAACLSFDMRKISFRAREALCVQGALQIKKQTLNPFIDGNEWKQAAFLYKNSSFTVLLIVQTLLSWSYGVWQNGSRFLYKKSLQSL